MRTWQTWALTGVAAAMLAACGGGSVDVGIDVDNSGARGSLLVNPPTQLSKTDAGPLAAMLGASDKGKGILALAGTPRCGVDVRHFEYGTVGGADERTTASGALMLPTGSDPACSGARPVVLYAHGTAVERSYNIANITDSSRPGSSEGLLIASLYAAQGFIVVAPNYAGYDRSRLAYHPYLNADQSAKEMQDALTAARKALPKIGGVSDGGKLLITGYSQGGHVAMATHRAMQAAGLPVTASAPLSGPYALGLMGDSVFAGRVNLGATIFVPMLTTSYQKAYGKLYRAPQELFTDPYASAIETVFPADAPESTLLQRGSIPMALFSSTAPNAALADMTPPTSPAEFAPLFALGFGQQHLMHNSARLTYLQDLQAHPDGTDVNGSGDARPAKNPQHPMRQALTANDLRNWTPQRPMLLCGGGADPAVYYRINTETIHALWSDSRLGMAAAPGLVTALDVDSAATGINDPYAAVKAGFAQTKAQALAQGGAQTVMLDYHRALVPPFCNAAARGFFQKVLAAGG